MESESKTLATYRTLALQVTCQAVNRLTGRESARAQMQETINRLGRQISASIAWLGEDVRLVVLPEYILTGFPLGETIEEWRHKACLEPEGAEYEALGRIAQQNGIFLAGNAYEVDAHFPGFYFQSCFVIDPSGSIVLRYRRLNSMYTPTPHDVWDRYLDIYGLEGVFPVARTMIGNLAAVASEEILYPELVRCLVMRGAEVLVHPTSEIGSPGRTPKDVAKIARAVENLVYVVSANTAGVDGIPIPVASADGGSMIIDYKGLLLAEAGLGESIVAYADLNLSALRQYRRRPGLENILSRQRLELYAESYRQFKFYPANTLLDKPLKRQRFLQVQQETIERLVKCGVIQE